MNISGVAWFCLFIHNVSVICVKLRRGHSLCQFIYNVSRWG